MNKFSNQKLISTSIRILLTLRVLLVVLLLMAIIPWIIPTSIVGSFLIQWYSIMNLIEPKYFDHFLNNLSLLSRVFGIIGSFISLLPLIIGTFIMIKVSKNYIIGDVFSFFNTKSYRNLGILYLLSALLLQPLALVLFSLSVSFIHNPIGKKFIAVGININNLTAIFFAVVLIVIGQVMKLGQQINEEQALTV